MKAKKFLVTLLVFVILVSGVTACTSAPKEDASAPVTTTAISRATAAVPQAQATALAERGLRKLHPEWTSYTNGNFVHNLLVQENVV